MKRNSRTDEIEKLEREVADLQRMARPEIASGDLDRLRGVISQLRHDFYQNIGPVAANSARAPPAAPLHDGLRAHPL